MYLCVSLDVDLNTDDHGRIEALDCHRPGVTGRCEAPYLAAENKTWDLCKTEINKKRPPAPKLWCFMTLFVLFMKLLPYWNVVI